MRRLSWSPFSVTNNLQVQDVYSIRGLQPATSYDLKVWGESWWRLRRYPAVFPLLSSSPFLAWWLSPGDCSQPCGKPKRSLPVLNSHSPWFSSKVNVISQPSHILHYPHIHFTFAGHVVVLQMSSLALGWGGLSWMISSWWQCWWRCWWRCCRASLSIAISVLCLFLASLGVCFCIRKSEWISVEIFQRQKFSLTLQSADDWKSSQSKFRSGRAAMTRCPSRPPWRIGRTWNSTWELLFLNLPTFFLNLPTFF